MFCLLADSIAALVSIYFYFPPHTHTHLAISADGSASPYWTFISISGKENRNQFGVVYSNAEPNNQVIYIKRSNGGGLDKVAQKKKKKSKWTAKSKNILLPTSYNFFIHALIARIANAQTYKRTHTQCFLIHPYLHARTYYGLMWPIKIYTYRYMYIHIFTHLGRFRTLHTRQCGGHPPPTAAFNTTKSITKKKKTTPCTCPPEALGEHINILLDLNTF